MHLLKPLQDNKSELSSIFEKIFKSNAVALLGAGASVSNLKFLSKDLINLYQSRISKDFRTENIQKFVDILQNTAGLSRADFDSFVIEQIENLTPNKGHEIFVTIPWKQVLTTNYDTLIEEASDKAIRAHNTHYKVKTIRNKNQYDVNTANDEIKYVKLHGCKSDLSLYPLVFSTQDFVKVNSFYKKALSSFKGFSNEIIYIAFGYSFSDELSENLLDKLLNEDLRLKRTIYCVDPFVNEDNLEYYASMGISIIKLTFEEFFLQYSKWFEDTNKSYLRTLQKYLNPDNSVISMDTGARLYLDKSVIQFKDDFISSEKVKKIDFYNGSEPNYQIILEGYDVIRLNELRKLLGVFDESFNGQSLSSIPKLVLISGDFGSGKTTFTLRGIREFIKKDNSTLGFEITNGVMVKKGYLAKLISESTADKFIFYCDNIETDSILKRFNEIRVEMASEQYSDKSIIFVSSIRENILEKLKSFKNFSLINSVEFIYQSNYNKQELSELVDNLKEVGLLTFRDKVEKNAIVHKLSVNYGGDSFISLYSLIENGTHIRSLRKAYEELTPEIQIAFKLTALIHRFNMECPVAIIKSAINTMDWASFTEHVVRGDGKKILFQEYRASTNSDPDLFFKTKHPVIAEALVGILFKNKEKNAAYKSIFSGLSQSEFNARFIVDLIKNIRFSEPDLTEGQRDNFYEICRPEFGKNIHFMLSYLTHKEKRTNEINTLITCLKEIQQIEQELDYRNSRLVHRKGSLNFKIAILLFRNSEAISEVKEYLDIAEEWFIIKKKMDPTSRYSYTDYLTLLLWKLRYFKISPEVLLDLHLSISSILDEGFRLIETERSFLTDRLEEYKSLKKGHIDGVYYLDFLLDQYKDDNTRSTACMLLYYYYVEVGENVKAERYVEQLLDYLDIKEVVYFMFKYYGRNLHVSTNRIKYFELIRYNSFLEEENPMRFYYFGSICDAYDRRWSPYLDCLYELKSFIPPTLNPDFLLYWCNEQGETVYFDGELVLDRNIKKVRVNTLYREFAFVKGNYRNLKVGDEVIVKLNFGFDGIKAELIREQILV